jgi:uncharacterized membrane protein
MPAPFDTGLPPPVAIHLTFALVALVLGPFALWARKGSRPHRAAGYMWVAMMVGAAVSAMFIRDYRLPNIAGYTPIHLLVIATFHGVIRGLWAIVHGEVATHRKAMQQTYFLACVGAGVFTLLPGRYLGHLLWHQTLGWV